MFSRLFSIFCYMQIYNEKNVLFLNFIVAFGSFSVYKSVSWAYIKIFSRMVECIVLLNIWNLYIKECLFFDYRYYGAVRWCAALDVGPALFVPQHFVEHRLATKAEVAQLVGV